MSIPNGVNDFLAGAERSARERSEEEALIRRARSGDTAAFAVLCERSRRRVWRVVASVTHGGADTDDLAQEAILRAFRSLASFRGDASFEAWLCRIALNAAHDHRKSAWRRRVVFWSDRFGDSQKSASSDEEALTGADSGNVGEIACDPGDEAERRDLQRRIRAAVASLGVKERVPIYLLYFEEFSLTEIARLEGVPESTVRSRVKAGLRRLQKSLGDLRLPDEPCAGGDSQPAEAEAAKPSRHSSKSMALATGGREWKGVRS